MRSTHSEVTCGRSTLIPVPDFCGKLKFMLRDLLKDHTDMSLSLKTVHSPLFFHKIVEIKHFVLWAAILDECQKLLWGRGTVWEEVRKIEGLMVCPYMYITAAHVQGTWQEFHTFYYSLIKKLCWCWNTCQKNVVALISQVTNISFRKCDFKKFLGHSSK